MKFLIIASVLVASGGLARAADLPSTLKADGQFEKLIAAAKAAGIEGALAGPGPFTLFAPTDAAFAAVPVNRMNFLMQPANRTDLLKLLGLHRVDGRVTEADWRGRTISTKAATGMPIIIADVGGRVTVNGVPVSRTITADNGVIHVIDAVITLPTPIAARTGR